MHHNYLEVPCLPCGGCSTGGTRTYLINGEQRHLEEGSRFSFEQAGRRSTFAWFLSVQDKKLSPCNHSTESFHVKYLCSATAQVLNFL